MKANFRPLRAAAAGGALVTGCALLAACSSSSSSSTASAPASTAAAAARTAAYPVTVSACGTSTTYTQAPPGRCPTTSTRPRT
jgi:hypothetical protein